MIRPENTRELSRATFAVLEGNIPFTADYSARLAGILGVQDGERYDQSDLRILLEHRLADLADMSVISPGRLRKLGEITDFIKSVSDRFGTECTGNPSYSVNVQTGWLFGRGSATIKVSEHSRELVSKSTLKEETLTKDRYGTHQGVVILTPNKGASRLLPVIDGMLRTHVHGLRVLQTKLKVDSKSLRPTGGVDLEDGNVALMVDGRFLSSVEHPVEKGLRLPIVEVRPEFTFLYRGLACASIVVRDGRRGEVELALVNDKVVRINNGVAVSDGGEAFGYRMWKPSENHPSGQGWLIARQDSEKAWYVPCDYGL